MIFFYLNYTLVCSFVNVCRARIMMTDYGHIFLSSTWVFFVFTGFFFTISLFFFFFTFNHRHALWLNVRAVGLKRRKTCRDEWNALLLHDDTGERADTVGHKSITIYFIGFVYVHVCKITKTFFDEGQNKMVYLFCFCAIVWR